MPDIQPAEGKLGVLFVGLGAVATTTIAGIELVRNQGASPVGSLAELGTVRLGRRDENRVAKVRDLVPLADLGDVVFGAWDIFPDDAFVAASRARVLEPRTLEQAGTLLRSVKPMRAYFDPKWVTQIDGPHVNRMISHLGKVACIKEDIGAFIEAHGCSRAVVVWTGSTEGLLPALRPPDSLEQLNSMLLHEDPGLPPSALYAYAALTLGVPFINCSPNFALDSPAMEEVAALGRAAIAGKDLKTGQTLVKTVLAPMLKARMLGLSGWFSTNILGNRDGEVLQDPDSFHSKEVSKLGVLERILEPDQHPDLYGDIYHRVEINYYPPRRDDKEGWDNIDLFGWLGYPMQLKVNFLCRDSILAAPLVLDLILFTDLAQRAGLSGIQEWLSFYFKSPQCARGIKPEHDLFIQLTKLKNTLRHLAGEEPLTHLGTEYYE